MLTRLVGKVALMVTGSALTFLLAVAPAGAQTCVGDCNTDTRVTIDELLLGVDIVLGVQDVTACEAFKNAQGKVDIAQLVTAELNLFHACPGQPTFTPPPTKPPTNTPTPTSTKAGATATASPTSTTGVSCPLAPGVYTVTQVSGGKLTTYSFAPFDFPAGGTIVEDVKAATSSDCVHDVVVPFPDGFTSPIFCVPPLGFTVSVTQTACGIGKLDSDGGSDFDTNELADSSDSSVKCNLPNAMPCSNPVPRDASIRVDITVGNGTPDSCTAPATANVVVSIPVHTVSWSDGSGGTFENCPGNGVFDAPDVIVSEFDQILDFTTATATGKWMDLDGDGCTIAGTGPVDRPDLFTKSGGCIDITKLNTSGVAVNTVAVGEFGATGGLFDGTFATVLPNTMSGPTASTGATCDSPPTINFSGQATRCIR